MKTIILLLPPIHLYMIHCFAWSHQQPMLTDVGVGVAVLVKNSGMWDSSIPILISFQDKNRFQKWRHIYNSDTELTNNDQLIIDIKSFIV